jgi:hypothetical protein
MVKVPDATDGEGVEDETDKQTASNEPIPVHLPGIGLELWRVVEEEKEIKESARTQANCQSPFTCAMTRGTRANAA